MKRTRVGAVVLGGFAMLLVASHVSADDSPAAVQTQIRTELAKWTDDFNTRNPAAAVCSLFAPDLLSNFRGEPEDSYGSLCANLQMALADTTKTYHYDLEIKEIIVACDLAVVRLVWTLKITPKDGPQTTTREPGLDIFRRQPDGSWKISRYMAYEAPGPE